MKSSFDLESYKKAIRFPLDEKLILDLESLKKIIALHVQYIPYQNFHLHYLDKIACSLSGEQFQERVQREGGCCYETSNLLFFALEKFGFQVQIIPTHVLNNSPYNPHLPSSHNILLVFIGELAYLIDVGFSYNSLAQPIKFNIKKVKKGCVFSEIIYIKREIYKLEYYKNFFRLNMKIKAKWLSFYRFKRPLETIDQWKTLMNYWTLLSTPLPMPIRDLYIIIGKVKENGHRIGFYYGLSNDSLCAFKFQTSTNLELDPKQEYKNLFLFQEEIQKEFKFRIPQKLISKFGDQKSEKNKFRFFQLSNITLQWNEKLSSNEILFIKNFFVKSYIESYKKCTHHELAIDPKIEYSEYFGHEFDGEIKKISDYKQFNIHYLIARYEDHPIGLISCELNKKSGRVYIRWAVIHQKSQRIGLGEKMFNAISKRFPESRGLELYTRRANIPSQRFYHKNGFTTLEKFNFNEPGDSKIISTFVKSLFENGGILYPPADEAFNPKDSNCFIGFEKHITPSF